MIIKNKNQNIILTTIVILLILFFVFYNTFSENKEERSFYNTIYKEALEKADIFEYGKNKEINKFIEFKAKAEGWWYFSSDGDNCDIIKTKNTKAPFIITCEYFFRKDYETEENKLWHMLTEISIYDIENGDWVPLVSELNELDSDNIKTLSTYSLWQGDYDIPHFK